MHYLQLTQQELKDSKDSLFVVCLVPKIVAVHSTSSIQCIEESFRIFFHNVENSS